MSDLAEITRPGDVVTATARQLLRLTVGSAMYAIDIAVVREILNVPALTTVPLMPSFMRGVMNLRGAVVPVIDLGARLGMADAALGKRSAIVVVDVGSDGSAQTLGLLVDAVHEVFPVAAEGLEPVPALGTRVPPAYLSAIARIGERIVPVLATEQVLELGELARLVGEHTLN